MIPRVGMKVKIVKVIKDWPGGFTSWMEDQVGKNKVWTIASYDKLRRYERVTLKEDVNDFVWPPECMVEVNTAISLQNVTLRGGKGQVSKVKRRRLVKERPIQAQVVIADHNLILTYCNDGRFYPDFDSPIDLVNT